MVMATAVEELMAAEYKDATAVLGERESISKASVVLVVVLLALSTVISLILAVVVLV